MEGEARFERAYALLEARLLDGGEPQEQQHQLQLQQPVNTEEEAREQRKERSAAALPAAAEGVASPRPAKKRARTAAVRLEEQLDVLLAQLNPSPPPSPTPDALRSPNRRLADDLDAAQRGVAELRLWESVLGEAAALCTPPVARIVERMLRRQRSVLAAVDAVGAEVRQRLQYDWVVDSLKEKRQEMDGRSRGRIAALADEVAREMQESDLMARDLDQARARLHALRPAAPERPPQSSPHADIIELQSGSKHSSQAVSDSHFYVFRLDPDDRGAVIWFWQEPAGDEHNYFEVSVARGAPPGPGGGGGGGVPGSPSSRHRVSTKGAASATLNLLASDSDMSLQSGHWFVRVQGRGSLLKSFTFELRVATQLAEVAAPLDQFLTEFESHVCASDRLGERMRAMGEDELGAAVRAAAEGVLGAGRKPATADAAAQYVAPGQGAGDEARARRSSAAAALSSRQDHFVAMFQHPLPRLDERGECMSLKAVVRAVNSMFSDRMAAERGAARARDAAASGGGPPPASGSGSAPGPSLPPMPQFVYERYKNRYGLARLAERQLHTLLRSLAEGEGYLHHPRVHVFARFCGLVHPGAALNARDLSFYLEALRTAKRHCGEQSVPMPLDTVDPCHLPGSIVDDVLHDLFASRPRPWRRQLARRLHASLGHDEMDLDHVLSYLVTQFKTITERYEADLRRLFALGDLQGDGFLTLESFLGVMRRVDSGRGEEELTRIFAEGASGRGRGKGGGGKGRGSRPGTPEELATRGVMTLGGLLRVGHAHMLLHRISLDEHEPAAGGEAVQARKEGARKDKVAAAAPAPAPAPAPAGGRRGARAGGAATARAAAPPAAEPSPAPSDGRLARLAAPRTPRHNRVVSSTLLSDVGSSPWMASSPPSAASLSTVTIGGPPASPAASPVSLVVRRGEKARIDGGGRRRR